MSPATVVHAPKAKLAAGVLEDRGVGGALVTLGAVGRQDFAAAGSQWAVRGAAGLHYALPVARTETVPSGDRPLVAVDPGGDPLRPGMLPSRAVLVFGTERDGLPRDLLERTERRVRIPMEPGVSSLNLATAVAVVLYAWRPER